MLIRRICQMGLIFCAVTVVAEDEERPAFEDTRPVAQTIRELPQVLVSVQGQSLFPVSIRAGSPNDAALVLNGLALRNPYSGLYGAELPYLRNLFADPTVKVGQGFVSFNLKPVANHLQGMLTAGTPEAFGMNVGGSTIIADQIGVGGFVDYYHADKVDHDANDLAQYTGGAQVQYVVDDTQVDLLAGYQQKEFGAQGYYGIPFSIFAEEETKDSLALFSWTHGDLSDSFFRTAVSWRQLENEYSIPASTHMFETDTQHASVLLEGQTMEIQHVSLMVRTDLSYEQIDGDTGEHERTYGSVLLLPQLAFERAKLSAGLNSVFYTGRSPDYLPQAGVDFFVNDNSTLYASYSESTRLPYYRDLYYSGPYHINNATLDRQKTHNSEVGFKQFLSASLDWQAAAFYRRLDGASDWTKNTAADVQWQSTDLGTMDVMGVEATIHYGPSDSLDLRAHYQWASKDEYNFYAGLYELDYPEHLLNVTGHWGITDKLVLEASQTLRYQTESAARNGSNFGADASVGLHCLPRFANNVRLSLMVNNLWNSSFEPFPEQKALKRTVSAEVTLAW